MEKKVTKIILSMQEPFTFQELQQKAQETGIEEDMTILSVMSKLGDEGRIVPYQYTSSEKVHKYVVNQKTVEP